MLTDLLDGFHFILITIFHDLKCFICEQGFLASFKAAVFSFFRRNFSDIVPDNFPEISKQPVLINDLCLTPYSEQQ